jgi:predicted transposase/invertase (TIGR01784 family)
VILDKTSYEHDLKDFSFSFIELPKFPIDKIENLKTIIEKWCYFFKYAAKTSEADLCKIIGSDLVIERAYEALNQFNWNETELIAYEQEIKRIMDNRAAEDYLVDKRKEIENKARLEGKAEGMEKGIEKGIEKTAINMLLQKIDDSLIKSVTGFSQDDLDKLRNKL